MCGMNANEENLKANSAWLITRDSSSFYGLNATQNINCYQLNNYNTHCIRYHWKLFCSFLLSDISDKRIALIRACIAPNQIKHRVNIRATMNVYSANTSIKHRQFTSESRFSSVLATRVS
jgi:hypothetical protein